MKTKIVCFSAVLLMVGVACQAGPTIPPRPPEPPIQPYYPPLPDKCPILQLQREIPARCCIAMCDSKYPETAYRSCEDRMFERYNCETDQQAIIHFMMFGCHCK